MVSLSQLKDALTALGVSTATGDLRGEARRDELAKRLHHARMMSGEVAGLAKSGDDEPFGEARKELETLSLSELRSALELRQISTRTPGLKGEARRHALVQRLMNGFSKQIQSVRDDLASGRSDSSDEVEGDDTKSEASSSVYSTATEFIFYDGVDTKGSGAQCKTTDLMPQLSFTKLKKQGKESRPEGFDKQGSAVGCKSTEQMQRDLFELRSKLHTSRQEQQQLVEQSLQKAGIVTSLGDISARLQVLEGERRRLQENYFGHELVTSDVLASSSGKQIPLEFVQEDALVLIEKHQTTLKQLAERTKEAMAMAKFHAAETEWGTSKSARQEEEHLLQQIRQVEYSLASSTQSSSSLPRKSPMSSLDAGTRVETPVLARCRSKQDDLHSDLWDQLDARERRQLHNELRTAASFHIRRGRVSINIPDSAGTSFTATRVPTQAEKLGMKARFMEKSQRSPDEISRAYQEALGVDDSHAENLGNYALFLCTVCAQFDNANAYFQRAIKADPTNAKNLANYANFLMRQREQYVDSEIYYKRALKIAGKDVNIMGGYADLLTTRARENRKNLQHAHRILKKALSLSPLHVKNQLRLALVLADLKENDEAERCFQQLLDAVVAQRSINNDSLPDIQNRRDNELLVSIYEKYASFLHRCRHWERAKRMYDQALALDSQRPSLLRKFSTFLRESKPFLSPRIERMPFCS